MWNWFESMSNCKFLCLSSPDQDDWNGTQRTAPGKAPPTSRGAKTSYREHPYRQYWSGLVTLSVSSWLVPVYHGSSRFKQPDKSNCLFCLWFVFLCFCFSYAGLYMKEQIGNWKSDLFFFYFIFFNVFWVLTTKSHLYPSFASPTNQQATNPSNLLDGLARSSWSHFFNTFWFEFFLFVCLVCCIFFSDPVLPTLWLVLQCWS